MYHRSSLILRVLALVLFVLSFSRQQQANVFRAASPGTRWDHLKTWLSTLTSTFLPNAAVDPQHLSNEQLDDNLNRLMAPDPTRSYSYKDWAKIIQVLAHNLKLQAEDGRRNQAQTQHRLDQRLVETQDQRRTADESKPKLQEELQRLQKALAELHLEVERRELLEQKSRKELTGKLQHGEALLAKAETELKERHAEARACENHPKQARKEIIALKPQRDYLKDGLDPGYRELKSGMGGETHVTEFPLTSQEALAAKWVKSPLPKTSSSQEPSPAAVKSNCQQLQQTFTQKLFDPAPDQRLPAAAKLKNPHACYSQMQRACFGARNQPAMEEDFIFKTLFLRELLPAVSDHLTALACSRSMSTQQLRDWVDEARAKQSTASEKTIRNQTSHPVSDHRPETCPNLFERLTNGAKRQNQTLKSQRCELNVQPHSQNEVHLEHLAPLHHTIGRVSLVPPVCVAQMDTVPCFIHKDLLDCAEPLLNTRPLKIWAQVCELLPFQAPRPPEPDGQVTEVAGNLPANRGNPVSGQSSSSLPCTLKLTTNFNSFCSKVITDSQLKDTTTTDIILTQWAGDPAFTHMLFSALIERTLNLPCVNKHTCFPLDFRLSTMTTAKVTCVLNLKVNDWRLTHHFLVLPDLLTHSKTQMDIANELVWALMTVQSPVVPVNTANFLSGHIIQEVCILINIQETVVSPYTKGGAVWPHTQETVVSPYTKGGAVWLHTQGTVVPPYTKGGAVGLHIQCGQTLNHTLGSFTLSPEGVECELSLKATPLTEVSPCVAHSWLNDCIATDTSSPKAYQLGRIMSHKLHDFELKLTVIGSIPDATVLEGSLHNTRFTAPFKIISITSIKLVPTEQVRRTESMEDQHLAVSTVGNQPACETQEGAAPLIANLTADTPTEEPFPRFESKGQQIQKDANALKNDADCQKLRQVLNKFKVTFAKDFLDCGLTRLHMVHSATHLNAPPTFVRQYKIHIASHEPAQEIGCSKDGKGVVHSCNSTYSVPIWPIVKPDSKWRPTSDFKKSNQQVPLPQRARKRKSAQSGDSAACQNCYNSTPALTLKIKVPQQQQPTCHRHLKENACQGMPTAYVDGRSYIHKGILQANAGVRWLNNQPCQPQNGRWGPQSCQFGEAAATLKTLHVSSAHNIREPTCTDSLYARLGFTCHLLGWKQTDFKTEYNMSVKHQHLFHTRDDSTQSHDMIVYWEKVKRHSKQPGRGKGVNDQTNVLAKTGTPHGNLRSPPPQSPTLGVATITHRQRSVPATVPASLPLPLTTKIPNTSLRTVLNHHSNPSNHPITAYGPTAAPSHKRLHGINHMLRVGLNILKHVPDDLTAPELVMPQGQKGGELIYAHDTSCAKHHDTKTTDETLKQVTYWPSMQQDVTEYVRGCQVYRQVQTANPSHRAPLQHRGVMFPWSVNQTDWTVELPLVLMAIIDTMQESTRVSPAELTTARQVTLPLHLSQPGDPNITAYATHQHFDELRPQLREQLATQNHTLQTIGKSWKGIVVVLCTHGFLLKRMPDSVKQLLTVSQNDCVAQHQLVIALITDLLREVSLSMESMVMNRIPQYPVNTVLDFATGRPTNTIPAHLADSLDAAILLRADTEQNEVAVLLNLPISEPDNIYRPKDKVNVRWWQGNIHPKIHTSDVVVYHYSDPQLYLAPHLSRCILTKDIYYLGSNKPSLRNHTEGMGRLQPMTSDTRCPAETKPRTQVIGTQAEIVGDRLLVHTPTHAATLTYHQHDIATRVSLPNPSRWIQVPLGSILHLDHLAVYCLSSKEDPSELEIPSSPRSHHHTLDPEWEPRIDKGGSQLSDSTPIDAALQALSRLPVLTSSPIAQAWTAADTALCLSIATGYALTLGLASILLKGMQESLDRCLAALPQGFKRRQERGSVKSKRMPSLIEMDREPVGTTCCLTIRIQVPSNLFTVQRSPHRNFVGRRGDCSVWTRSGMVNQLFSILNSA